MKLLIIGGTIFLGRYIADEAIKRGHTVTLFNRGKHNPDLFPEAEKLHGDRREDVSALAGRTWDAAIDTCGYLPRDIRATGSVLNDAVVHYTFVSSISVYNRFDQTGLAEDASVGILEDEEIGEITGETYGPLKLACERTAQGIYGDRTLAVRPGLIVGPHDPTDRFSYWPRRTVRGGDMLVPGNPMQPVQFIDVRDLASWMVSMAERQQSGVFNATGPEQALSMQQFIEECRHTLNPEATPVWIDEAFLLEREVQPFTELPLWVPSNMAGMHTVDCSKAIVHGLTFRSTGKTIRDTYEWEKTKNGMPRPVHSMRAERESALLQEWQGR